MGFTQNIFEVLSRRALGKSSRVCRKLIYGNQAVWNGCKFRQHNKELIAVFCCDCIFWNPCLLERRE